MNEKEFRILFNSVMSLDASQLSRLATQVGNKCYDNARTENYEAKSKLWKEAEKHAINAAWEISKIK